MRKKIPKHMIFLNAVRMNPGLDQTISCHPFSVGSHLGVTLGSRETKARIWSLGQSWPSGISNLLKPSLVLNDRAPCITGVGRWCSFGHRDCMGDTIPYKPFGSPSLFMRLLQDAGLLGVTHTNKSMAPEYDKLYILIASRCSLLGCSLPPAC